jgi:uncharacterized protein YciI
MMLFAVWARDRAGALDARLRVREQHRVRLRAPAPHAVEVRLAGPLFEAPGGPMSGTLLVVAAEGIDAVRAFIETDPYMLAGVYATVDIRPWHCGLGSIGPPGGGVAGAAQARAT